MAAQSSGQQIFLHELPDVALGKIISFLHWKEKEWLVMAFPPLERVINSPLAWQHFENNRAYAVEKLDMYYFPMLVDREIDVIRRFGQYFQSCTIWIHKIFSFDNQENDDLHLLLAVSRHCKQLKSLTIMHPSDISFGRIKSLHDKYLKPIQKLCSRKPGSFSLGICRVFYTSIDTVDSGIVDFINFINDNGLAGCIVILDFSHGLVFDSHIRAVYQLKQCSRLETLKCPIQSVNTDIILELGKQKLTDLYLVSDDHTSHLDYYEKENINWPKIYNTLPQSNINRLKVHAIFKNRILGYQHLIPNPFVTSLVFDNLSSDIPAPLLHRIADLYGPSLQTLAFCSHYWEFLMHFSDLGQIDNSFRHVGTKCKKLKSFLTCLSIPSSALVSLANHSSTLTNLQVFKENIRLAVADKPEVVFKQKIAHALNSPDWNMVKKGTNIYTLPGVDSKLLFANCFSEI